jgi:hypothetical protein
MGLCVYCKTRKARYAKGPTCEPCHRLTEAEGTAKKLGLESKRHRMWRERITNYNKLVRRGHKQIEIAKMWKMHPSTLSSRMRVTAKILKMKLEPTRHLVSQNPDEVPTRNEHGQGWGRKHCRCELCVVARRGKRREANRRWRLSRKLKAQGKSNKPS